MLQEKWIMDQWKLENLEIDIGQLQRTGITSAAGRFLVGMWFETQKTQNIEKYGRPRTKATGIYIAEKLNIAPVSVRRYAQYARALETVQKECPELAAQILSGECTLSMQKVVEIAEMKRKRDAISSCRSIRISEIPKRPHSRQQPPIQDPYGSIPSIKDMPAYDPDAEFTGLALTVPSWIGSINRVRSKSDLCEISDEAKAALAAVLAQLQGEIMDMLRVIKEE